MILAIDIGNSNITIGGVEDEKIIFEARMATDRIKTSDQYSVELKNLIELFKADLNNIDGCIVASVVPPVSNSFYTAIRKVLGIQPMIVGPGIKTGLNILVDNPAQVGSDLIVAAVAALRVAKPPMAIVDMGTATTITVIDENGAFLGGSICTGVKISMEALTSRTAQLPAISLEQPKRVIGRNTVECMQSGLMVGTAAMLDGLVDRMEEELGQPLTVIATGGIARFVIPMCRREVIYERDLLLKGLAILYKNNVKRREN
ncbi:MAG: type III pantothenate kinase [Ruminococcaceae bacterium]|nr:type III pantothenate kinase [Oscillospiraceae bacterium]